MLPRAEFVHWWFATGFLIIGLLLLAEALVGEAVWRRRSWRVYLWPSFLFLMGVSHTTTFVGIVFLVSADAGKG
jgi:hypothetical protein